MDAAAAGSSLRVMHVPTIATICTHQVPADVPCHGDLLIAEGL